MNSNVTVHLITKVFEELKANPQIRRTEALRQSMLALIRKAALMRIRRTGRLSRWSKKVLPANPFALFGCGI